jgi:hypothetical protein
MPSKAQRKNRATWLKVLRTERLPTGQGIEPTRGTYIDMFGTGMRICVIGALVRTFMENEEWATKTQAYANVSSWFGITREQGLYLADRTEEYFEGWDGASIPLSFAEIAPRVEQFFKDCDAYNEYYNSEIPA